MKVLKILLLVILASIALLIGGLYATGNSALLTLGWAVVFGGPAQPFDPEDAVAPPDYADEVNWAALPSQDGVEDRYPAGISAPVKQGGAPVDVFFIHPTGYLKGNSWIFSMDANTSTEENTQWMMANQASAYNSCCNVYAPRYRQANIFAYFKGEDIREEVLAFAYTDVERAFDFFIDNYNQGRPFVLASHSQGTHHAIRLLKEKIDTSPLAQRLVAAYIIGGGIATAEFTDMQDISICDDPTQLHCAVHWDTWSEAVIDQELPDSAGNVCVNPLSWRRDGGPAGMSSHAGAVPVSGAFQVELSGEDLATGVVFEPLAAAQVGTLDAQCKDGLLYITDQSETDFGNVGGSFGGGNYHGLDYPVFHMDIRENALLRTQTYVEKQ